MKVPDADQARTLARFLPQSECALRVGAYDNRAKPLRRELVLGYETVVFENTGAGEKTTVWVAPKLDCAELIRVDERLNPAGFSGVTGSGWRRQRFSKGILIQRFSTFRPAMTMCRSARNSRGI